MAEYTDSFKINGLHLTVEWDIDVDTPVIEAVTLDDSCGECLLPIMAEYVKRNIKQELNKKMIQMERETAAWKGQYNNV